MEIQNYLKESFSSLTVIRDTKTGSLYFILKQISEQWGHTNPTQAMKSARLDKNDRKMIILSKYPNLKEKLTNLGLVTSKTPWLTLVTEPGLNRLILNSKLKKSRPFYDWIVRDIIPTIRKTGEYSIFWKDKYSGSNNLDDKFLVIDLDIEMF